MAGVLWRVHGQSRSGLTGTARPVPVFTCASRPRGLRQAGEIADGVIIENGVSEDAIEQALNWIAEGGSRRVHAGQLHSKRVLRSPATACE